MDEKDKQIIGLWKSGLTGGNIAKAFGTTRSAIMGKLHRMRRNGILSGENYMARVKSVNHIVRKKEEIRVLIETSGGEWKNRELIPWSPPILAKSSSPSVLPYICEDVQTAPAYSGNPVKLDKLTPKSCRFIVNDGNPKDFLFCGKEKVGRSYCAEHESLCYYRPNRKADAE